jgi:outer membrane protein OmpA-like peptidoglycan-associated protein
MPDDGGDIEESSPATRLLEALGRGDLGALLLEFRPTTIVRTEDRTWAIQGDDEVVSALEEALTRFPGLVFDSHARHIGYGQVIEEARVRDLGQIIPPAPEPSGADGTSAGAESDAARAAGRALLLDRQFGKSTSARLNMPLRVTVMHDDQNVHEIILSYPKALFRAALGLHVDPLDMAVSEIQSAFVAPVGSGFRTYHLEKAPPPPTELPVPAPLAPMVYREIDEEPELQPGADLESVFGDRPPEPVPEPMPGPEPEPEAASEDDDWRPPPYLQQEEDEPRRRALVLIPLVVVLIAAIAGGVWWLGRDTGTTPVADTKPKPHHSQSQKGDGKPTKKPGSSSPAPTKAPTSKPPKPDVILKSDLAFPKNSAALSDAAKQKIADLAVNIKKAHLHGTILIAGYTDNLGSAESGVTLSKARADTVAQYLRGKLGSYRVSITTVGNGEADPVASNATEAGRQKNRRVTITLPKK